VQTVAEERIIEENEGSGWWLLLLPLLFIGLGYLLWNFVLRDRNKDPKVAETITTTIEQPSTENKDSIAAVELNAAQHAAIQDSIKAAEEALAAQKAATTSQTDSYTPPPRPSSPKATVEADRGYYMVISSTPRKELADRKTKDLISRNLKAATLPGPKNYWRTAIWLDANQSAAKQRLNELKGAFPDGWLLNY